MSVCLHCRSEVPSAARFCPACGWEVSSVSAMAETEAAPRGAAPALGGFAPGTVLAERYRIIGLLGRGGMGEVYRADDLRLGQAVALKFLPRAFSGDARLLERFHGEARNARQVSHPNVCRVYDIGEVQGRHFLTMEYVDGEDLASLLRRIGRLPSDKGLEIAHQLCAGLAAAHDRGVLHRDLKPANIMIDGRGRARITDFGLAVSAGEGQAEFAGTPAYMAPEQLSGAQATVKSDIYSLGLVLYEVYTGKRAFEGDSIAELRRKHSTSAPKLPSSITAEVDPAVERAILRCLAEDPAKRPASALQVAAALPGGDPLAAAIAAGETPSPEMVAAAGGEQAIAPRTAGIMMAAIVALILCLIPLQRRGNLLGVAPLARTPDGFADRAGEIVRRLGYTAAPADSYGWNDTAVDYLRYRSQREPSPARVRDLAGAVPGPHRFFFRQSPQPLVPVSIFNATVTRSDPPLDTPGMISLVLDGGGRLLEFREVPPRFEESAAPRQPDWAALFAEAGLDMSQFKPAAPVRVPAAAFDARAAWDGSSNGISLHVDAAAFHGNPVEFDVLGPWARRDVPQTWQKGATQTAYVIGIGVLFLGLPVCGLFLARRNMRLGRGDPKGAWRVAAVVTAAFGLQWLFGGHHPGGLTLIPQAVGAVALALFLGAVTWVSYMALEPLVRRQSPHLLISWTRLVSGGFTDPLVGRDLLVGTLIMLGVRVINLVRFALPWWFNIPGVFPFPLLPAIMGQPQELVGFFWLGAWFAIILAMLYSFLLAIGRLLLPLKWAAAALTLVLIVPIFPAIGENLSVELPFVIASAALWAYGLTVYGPLVFAVALFTGILLRLPLDLGMNAWYAGRALLMNGMLVALAAWGMRSALAGRSLFAARLLDEE